MRVGIVGGGISGLACAWVLEGQHEVTLFEREPRLGGHARTIEVPAEGSTEPVETGFEFFFSSLWPTFERLLDALGVEVRDYPCRIVIHRKGSSRTSLVQPMHLDGRFAPGALTPRNAFELAQFALVLASVRGLMKRCDTSITVGQVLSRAPVTRSFRETFLLPFLQSGWCVAAEELRGFAAYDVFRYSYVNLSFRGSAPMREVQGGMRAYVAALVGQMPSVTLRQAVEIAGIERSDGTFVVRERDGRSHELDELVVATGAPDAVALLRQVPGAEKARALLERIGTFRTRIAVHGDRRVMPVDERRWSIVNIRYDDRYAHTTVWKPWRSARLFRSWVTFEPDLPEPLYEVVEFDHVKPTPDYFATQRALGAEQGKDGLWLAGMHMHDVDSHESALLSGVRVAARLAPQAPRLRKLLPAP
jgi:predicted NAD/FAD-binding protein